MASVIFRAGRWYLQFKDGSGRWRRKVSRARTEKEAQRLADDLERSAEPQRLGLAPTLPTDGGETVADILRWWLKSYAEGRPGYASDRSHARHILGADADPNAKPPRPARPEAPFASTPVYRLRAGEVNAFMEAKRKEGLAPQTRRHIRRVLHSAFERAREVDRFLAENPITKSKTPKVAKTTVGDYLREHEVDPVLGALRREDRPLFATAIFEALRKSELLKLEKGDVDFDAMQIRVAPSKHTPNAEFIPIHRDVVPWLKEAIRTSPGKFVFPGLDGKRRRTDAKLARLFRTAMARAGIVTGYVHRCRKKGCQYAEPAADASIRRCPTHGVKLWPKAHVRPIRFHDLRHTAATLMLRAGGGLPAVQKLLRHSDPKTTQVYAHLEQEWVRETMNRVSLKLTIRPSVEEPMAHPVEAPEVLAAAWSTGGPSAGTLAETGGTLELSQVIPPVFAARDEGVEPTTFGSGGASDSSPSVRSASQACEPIHSSRRSRVHRSHPGAALSSAFGPQVVQRAGRPVPRIELLSVTQAAERLRVSTATVYRLCDLGQLRHVRVLNAIRISPADLDAYIAKGSR